MSFLAGIDESGYGPLLGPLVVSATLWRFERGGPETDLWDDLVDCVRHARGRGDRRLVVDDSKKAFDRKRGIASLERAVLAFGSRAGLRCGTLAELLASLGADVPALGATIPWYRALDVPLPLDRAGSAYEGVSARLAECMAAGGIACGAMVSEVVAEDAFNRRVSVTRNKAAVLVEQVLRLIQRVAGCCGTSDLHVVIDRLGGRSDYRPLLLDAFPDRHLHVIEVSDERSCYCLASARNDLVVEFLVDADGRHLPVALASMLSKYVREALMQRFNDYWRRRVPSVRATAGYYADAKRFLVEIRSSASDAGIPLEQFVRAR